MAHTSNTNAAGPRGASGGGGAAATPPHDVVSAGLAGITTDQWQNLLDLLTLSKNPKID